MSDYYSLDGLNYLTTTAECIVYTHDYPETERRTDGQTGRQAGRQADRQTESDTERDEDNDDEDL